jgi:LacI family transcriptional regulator
VIDACTLAGINVPHEAAVLGVDNDEDLCEACIPAMSSIAFEAERVGYEGMMLLDQLMRGSVRKPRTITYGPGTVVQRPSTDTSQIRDIVITRAREFIALNACAGIGVNDVVRHVRVSRRLMELKFRRFLGHTVLEEIQLKKLEHARMMLTETLRPIGEITASCGFETATHLGVLFRRNYGCTMSEYRATGKETDKTV